MNTKQIPFFFLQDQRASCNLERDTNEKEVQLMIIISEQLQRNSLAIAQKKIMNKNNVVINNFKLWKYDFQFGSKRMSWFELFE